MDTVMSMSKMLKMLKC